MDGVVPLLRNSSDGANVSVSSCELCAGLIKAKDKTVFCVSGCHFSEAIMAGGEIHDQDAQSKL